LLCGDLTDHGRPDEAEALSTALRELRIPCVAVLGNHDYEDGRPEVVIEQLAGAGVSVLDGESLVLADRVGVAGVKGFGGGFGRSMLQAFGEPAIKAFVAEALGERDKLEQALGGLQTAHRVVLLHYAPVAQTIAGEPGEIQAFLGSGNLLTPIERHKPDVVFHGHAHNGSIRGTTPNGVPVFNVAMPLIRRAGLGSFIVIELGPNRLPFDPVPG